MFVVIRTLTPKASHLGEVVTLASLTRDRLRDTHNINADVAVQIGDGPPTIAITHRCRRLGDLEPLRSALITDKRLNAAMKTGSEMVTDIQDVVARVLKRPARREHYALVNVFTIDLANMRESVAAAMDAAEFLEHRLKRSTGVLSAVTGDRARVGLVALTRSLDEIGHDVVVLERTGALDRFLKRSKPFLVPGTIQQSIWHVQNPGATLGGSGKGNRSLLGRRSRGRTQER